MRNARIGAIPVLLASLLMMGAAPAQQKRAEELKFTMPPKEFKKRIEDWAKTRKQMKEDRTPKPPETLALVLEVLGGGELRAGERTLSKGSFILDGETLRTGDAQSVRVGYKTGDQVLIAPRAEVRFIDVDESDRISNPILDLVSGEVRVLVKSPEIRAKKPKEGNLVYVVRTADGIFAATGTDYIVYAKPDLVSVHTLTGTVRYSKDLATLTKGGGEEIPAAHFASLSPPDRKLRAAKQMDVGVYIKAHEKRLPQMRKLWISADLDARNGKVRQRYLNAEEARTKPRVPSAFTRPNKKAK